MKDHDTARTSDDPKRKRGKSSSSSGHPNAPTASADLVGKSDRRTRSRTAPTPSINYNAPAFAKNAPPVSSSAADAVVTAAAGLKKDEDSSDPSDSDQNKIELGANRIEHGENEPEEAAWINSVQNKVRERMVYLNSVLGGVPQMWQDDSWTPFIAEVAEFLRDAKVPDTLIAYTIAGLVRYYIGDHQQLVDVAGTLQKFPDSEGFNRKLREEGVPAATCDLLFKKYVMQVNVANNETSTGDETSSDDGTGTSSLKQPLYISLAEEIDHSFSTDILPQTYFL